MEYNWQLQMCLTTIKLFEFGQNFKIQISDYEISYFQKISKKWKLCCWRQSSIGKYMSSKNSLHANLQLFNDRILQILHLSRWSHQMIMSVKSRATCARFAVNLHSAFCFIHFSSFSDCISVNSVTVFVSTACMYLSHECGCISVLHLCNMASVWL